MAMPIMRVQVTKETAQQEIRNQGMSHQVQMMSGPLKEGQTLLSPSNVSSPYADVGRNDLCPCGSGKKFKKCHGA